MEIRPTSDRLPSLDGWRAVSILMVLGSHCAIASPEPGKTIYNWLFDGILGVKFFFVISGFLITWLLLQEARHHGRISLRHFYVRRCLRILPAYFAFLLALYALQCCTRFQETKVAWLGLLTFTRDFDVPAHGSIASGHFWSLSVEEQFYLIWPAGLVFLLKRGVRARIIVLLIPIFAAPLFRIGHYIFYTAHQNFFVGAAAIHLKPAWLENLFLSPSFFCTFDALSLGCLCAVLLAHQRESVTGLFKNRQAAVVLVALLLIVVPHAIGNLPEAVVRRPGMNQLVHIILPICGPSLQAMGFSLLLLHSLVQPDWRAYRFLNWKWVGWIGMISYSLYIWQQPICFRAWEGADFWESHPDAFWSWFWLVPAFAAACVSYYGLERPLFRLRSRFRHE